MSPTVTSLLLKDMSLYKVTILIYAIIVFSHTTDYDMYTIAYSLCTVPGPVVNSRRKATVATDVTFEWDPPVPTGKHGPIVSYIVEYGVLDADGTVVDLANDSTSVEINLTGM